MLDDIRPKAYHLDADPSECTDPDIVREGTLERYGNMHVQTGGRFLDRWNSAFTSMALPFVIPRMVSGPDYPRKPRWRRVAEDAPEVTPTEFLRGFARRVEAQVRNDHAALPIVRSNWFQYVVETGSSMFAPYLAKKDQPRADVANDLIKAAAELHQALWHGNTGAGRHKTPINGDTTRLPYANGISKIARRLAWNMHFRCQTLPGVQQIRRLMGHAQLGARVFYGDCLFITVSPNSQQSGLVLKLSRYRRNDPFISGTEAIQQCISALAGRHKPNLEARKDSEETDLPDHEFRRICGARDPLAVIDAYTVNIRIRLARLLGLRMCPWCPRCNTRAHPCQDRFGSNMMPMGGVLGAAMAFGSATEFQTASDPHVRGVMFL